MTAARPVLGVTSCHVQSGGEQVQSVIDRYAFAAMRWADAAALLVPAAPELMNPREVAARLDGLMLTGSPSNVAAERYSDSAESGVGPFDADRDAMAFGLIEAMIDLGRPIFAVCRGFQEVNVAFGGTLNRDVNTAPHVLSHHAPDGVDLAAMFAHEHPVALTPNGVLARGLGCDRLDVNSVHFQGIARLGAGLSVEAVAPDGLIEGVSAFVNGAQILAVQWHPEWRTETRASSQMLFAMLGRALRGGSFAQQEGGISSK
jgi:putative glutamine amidotransferase